MQEIALYMREIQPDLFFIIRFSKNFRYITIKDAAGQDLTFLLSKFLNLNKFNELIMLGFQNEKEIEEILHKYLKRLLQIERYTGVSSTIVLTIQ